MLLEWLGARHDEPGLLKASELIETGVVDTVRAGTMTPDMGGTDQHQRVRRRGGQDDPGRLTAAMAPKPPSTPSTEETSCPMTP